MITKFLLSINSLFIPRPFFIFPIFDDVSKKYDENKIKDDESKKIFDILNKHKTPNSQITIKVEEDKFKLANLSKIVSKKDELKKTGEIVVLGAELFSIIAGLFA